MVARRHRFALLAPALALALSLGACASSDGAPDALSADVTPTSAAATTTPSPAFTTAPATTSPPAPATTSTTTTSSTTTSTTTTSTTTTSSTTTSTTTTSTTVPVDTSAVAVEPADGEFTAEFVREQIETNSPVFTIGTSLEGRPIVAERVSATGGRKVLVIGVIHGNEDAGIQIVDELRQRAIDDSIELWLIESMNPDGVARQDRHNSNEVDLNRNFPYKWGPIGEPGNSQYAGSGPASEPETQAAVQFITLLRPDIAIWYHQDANLIIPSTGRDGRIRARYAELTTLPLADCCGTGGIYTGIAATWARNELKQDSDAVPFIVELPGGELSDALVEAHANAVLTIGLEG